MHISVEKRVQPSNLPQSHLCGAAMFITEIATDTKIGRYKGCHCSNGGSSSNNCCCSWTALYIETCEGPQIPSRLICMDASCKFDSHCGALDSDLIASWFA
mmetsp:Transcript_86612/g.171939  ORF Transcript_86612/g.171939 Transcript_86612/m.171939 type:complete len:101 (-) Transcript_86612:435-737(-)